MEISYGFLTLSYCNLVTYNISMDYCFMYNEIALEFMTSIEMTSLVVKIIHEKTGVPSVLRNKILLKPHSGEAGNYALEASL